MKRFTAIALAALMVLTVFASVIPATAATVDTVEIRGPVYDGVDFAAIIAATPGGNLVMDYNNFAGFYYDFDNDAGSETLTILSTKTDGARTIDKDGLVYSTTIIPGVDYEYDGFGPATYEKIGFLAEEYVPIELGKAAKLSKLLIDDDESHTVRTGEAYELAEGYAVTAKQVDVDGNKVWLELTKDGEYVADKIIFPAAADTWDFDQDIAGVDDVTTLLFRVDEVFQGQVDSLAVIKGVWQISDNVIEIDSDTEAGVLKASAYSGNTITMQNDDDTLSLSKDSTVEITDDLVIETADSNNLRFFIMKEYTAPGTYEVRGPAAAASTYNVAKTTDATKFAGFYYDLKNNIYTETLTITTSGTGSRTIAKDAMVYSTLIAPGIAYKFSGFAGAYEKIAFFAEEYVPIESGKAAKLSKLLVDDDESHTVRTGEAYELGEGYTITANQVDVEGDKVWLELTKDGEYVADKIIFPLSNSTWNFDQDIAGVDDVVTLKIDIDEVFQGQVDSLAVIKGIWQISDSVFEIDSNTEVGILKAGAYSGSTITMENDDDTVSLSSDSTITIADDFKIKVAKDTTTARIYLFREMIITGEVVEEAPVEEPEAEPEADEAEPEAPVTEPEAPEVEPEAPVIEPEAPEVEAEPPEEEPGFEAVFAIAGLLAVAFLVRRNK